MMAGKSVVHSVSAGNDLLCEVGCGIKVAPNDPAAIAKAALALGAMTSEEKQVMGQKCEAFIRAKRTLSLIHI